MKSPALRKLPLYLTLLVAAGFFLLPIYVVLATSLKGFDEINLRTMWDLPSRIQFANFIEAFDKLSPFFWNSVNTGTHVLPSLACGHGTGCAASRTSVGNDSTVAAGACDCATAAPPRQTHATTITTAAARTAVCLISLLPASGFKTRSCGVIRPPYAGFETVSNKVSYPRAR